MAQQTIVAHFDTRSQAEIAQQALASEGIGASAMRLLPEEGSGSTYARGSTETSYDHRQDKGGFWASLATLGLPEDDRYSYAEGMSRGGVTLSVTTDEAHYERVADILEHNGAVDLEAREAEWRSAGWSGYAGSAATTGATAQASTARSASSGVPGDEDVVQVVEEQLRVGKRDVDRGRVRIRSYIVETPVEAQVELRSERVHVERRPVNQPVSGTADALFREQTLEAREHAEQAVVAKEARVVEEIGLRQEAETHTETVRDTVRKTEVEVEDDRTTAERQADRLQGTSRLTD